jgi:hypothetical protein
MTERRRPNAAKHELPPGATVRKRGSDYTQTPAWTPFDYAAQREETKRKRLEERAARRQGT